jgi:hypothetical protein
MKTAQDIINNARFELVTLIITLMRKIDAYLETGNKSLMNIDERVCVDFNWPDIVDKTPVVNVEVDNSYLDVEDKCYEPQHIDYIVTEDDHNFYLSAGETDIDADDLSTDELVAIAKFLENTYNEY